VAAWALRQKKNSGVVGCVNMAWRRNKVVKQTKPFAGTSDDVISAPQRNIIAPSASASAAIALSHRIMAWRDQQDNRAQRQRSSISIRAKKIIIKRNFPALAIVAVVITSSCARRAARVCSKIAAKRRHRLMMVWTLAKAHHRNGFGNMKDRRMVSVSNQRSKRKGVKWWRGEASKK